MLIGKVEYEQLAHLLIRAQMARATVYDGREAEFK
jgi:hypothetical protein